MRGSRRGSPLPSHHSSEAHGTPGRGREFGGSQEGGWGKGLTILGGRGHALPDSRCCDRDCAPPPATGGIDPKETSSVPWHRLCRRWGAVRGTPKPGRAKLAEVPFRPNSPQAPKQNRILGLRSFIRQADQRPPHPAQGPPAASKREHHPAAPHKSGALRLTPPPRGQVQKKEENHRGSLFPTPTDSVPGRSSRAGTVPSPALPQITHQWDQRHLSPVFRFKRTHRAPR